MPISSVVASTTNSQNSRRVAGLFGTVYDHLGGAVVLNLLWGLLSLPWFAAALWLLQTSQLVGVRFDAPIVMVIGLVAGLILVTYSPPTVLLLAATAPWIRGADSPDRGQLMAIVRTRALVVQAIGLGEALAAALLGANAVFYHHWGGWIGAMLSGFMMWLVLALVLISIYWLPLLCLDSSTPVRQILQQGVMLVFGRPLTALMLLATVICVAAMGILSGVGWLCGVVSLIAVQSYRVLAGLLPLLDALSTRTRTWREILRPWE